MNDILPATDLYRAELLQFERDVGGSAPVWVQQLRQAAMARFTEMGFPTTQEEAWRHTSVASLSERPFPLARHRCAIPKTELEPVTSWMGAGCRLVFVNGLFSPLLSSLLPLPHGMSAGSLAGALGGESGLLESHLGRYARIENHPFVSLNTAFLSDGAIVCIPPDTVIEEPLNVLFVSRPNGRATMSHPRTVIVAGPNSRATIVESYLGLPEDLYLTNAVTEVVLAENAVLDHYVLQQESSAAFHFLTLAVHQDRHSTFTSHSLATGGALARSEIHCELADEGITCILRGVGAVAGRQHLDMQTQIDHAKTHGTSQQLYKGILGGHASGVFNGKILVRQDAQKTDARQTNNNLLLSEDAVIHTKPQLEIFADDVKCAHGATVGRLDEEAVFYLRSRGIGVETARSLMTYAFGSETINLVTNEVIRDRLAELLAQWIAQTCGRSFSL
ncbi:MAG: Fe-S cluster assembly protein SufD [Nitrospirota bacterium]